MANTNQPPVDDESQRLLDELEQGDHARKQLEARAKALGLKFDKRISDDKLRERVAEAEAKAHNAAAPVEPAPTPEVEAPAPEAVTVTVTNASPRLLRIQGIDIRPEESHTLSQRQMNDERLMKKVNHAIKIGILTRGTD